MIPALTLEGFPAANGTHRFDWRGPNILAGASGTGKTTTIHALLALFGAADLPPGKLTVDALTGGGTTLRIAQGKSATSYERHTPAKGTKPAVDVDSKAWRDFAPWTVPAQDPDLVRAIALPGEWHKLATVDLARPLRDLFTRILPPVDVPARVAAIVTAAGLTPDPRLTVLDVKALLAKQTETNAAKDRATGAATVHADTLTKLRANPVPEVDEPAVTAAQALVDLATEWADYDRKLAAYETDAAKATAATEARAAWQAKRDLIPKHRPVADPGAVQVARVQVDEAKALVKRLEAEEREAAVAEAAAKATAEAERKAAEREAARAAEEARRAAEAPKPAAPPTPVTAVNPGPSLFAQASAAPVYSDDYRAGFKAGVTACVAWVADYREREEFPDVRTIRDCLGSVTLETV
jgi:hypothetical protein